MTSAEEEEEAVAREGIEEGRKEGHSKEMEGSEEGEKGKDFSSRRRLLPRSGGKEGPWRQMRKVGVVPPPPPTVPADVRLKIERRRKEK